MRNLFLSCLLACLCAVTAQAQKCKVFVENLSLSYEGECRGDKADGKGKAAGLDTYEGQFKAGYPDGQGKYTWKTGDWFEGNWKKGQREGQGSMHYRTAAGGDSLVTGFWKKDQYFGKFEKPFILLNQSSRVGTVKLSKNVGAKENDISVTITSTSGGTANPSQKASDAEATAADQPKLKLTSVDMQKGNFIRLVQIDNSARSTRTVVKTVDFPFKATFRIDDRHTVDIEFLEEGNYNVEINILN
ncbi:MORN repeat-containing protein [Sediminibacterium soli]|uniref:hypothetical protein n=1 Tax=Sediminibacterium soli TaxID=2698829 RepID=UPI0013796B83|nr:hypothetical protein [Sediminibacterium soli]NCI45581.1 hypothetical protein [Sediminibacterium soli]